MRSVILTVLSGHSGYEPRPAAASSIPFQSQYGAVDSCLPPYYQTYLIDEFTGAINGFLWKELTGRN